MRDIKCAAALAAALCFALAHPDTAIAGGMDAGFSVRAVIPDNQISAEAMYFDLLVEPGQEQVLTVVLENPGGEALTVSVEAVTAATSRDGVVRYGDTGPYDESMRHPFRELARVERDLLTVPPGEEAEAAVRIRVPREPFDGLVMGAIRVTGLEENGEDLGVVNRFGYVIGVRLRENLSPVAPEISLGDVYLDLVNYKAAFIVPVRNIRPTLAEGVNVTATVYDGEALVPVVVKRQEGVRIAPNSAFPMTLMDDGGHGFSPGAYEAEVMVEWGGEVLRFHQPFVVDTQRAQGVNGAAVNQFPGERNQRRCGAIVMWCIAAGAVLAAVLRRRSATGV